MKKRKKKILFGLFMCLNDVECLEEAVGRPCVRVSVGGCLKRMTSKLITSRRICIVANLLPATLN